MIDPKQPAAVSQGSGEYPTVPMYARKENFAQFDLETLFFAFYHQQGTPQQYLAAVELKKKQWQFNKKFETWFRKAESQGEVSGAACYYLLSRRARAAAGGPARRRRRRASTSSSTSRTSGSSA